MATIVKTGFLRKPANRDPDVLPQLIDGTRHPHVLRVLDGKRHVPHGPLAGPRRVGGTEAVTLQRGLSERAMRLDLLAQIGVVPRAAEQVQQTAKDEFMTRPSHVVLRTRWIAPTMRSNSARSAASCRRPAAVSV